MKNKGEKPFRQPRSTAEYNTRLKKLVEECPSGVTQVILQSYGAQNPSWREMLNAVIFKKASMDGLYQKEGNTCPHCGEGYLEYCPPDEPWSGEKLICGICSSTYLIE